VSAAIYVVNGPNLNLLGTREPEIYGHATLDDICNRCRAISEKHGFDLQFFQSNHEGAIVDQLQDAIDNAEGIIINAAAYTHTSVAIHDTLRAFPGPKIEVHLSNPHVRESFRHVSYVSPVVDGVIAGLGAYGYELAIDVLIAELKTNSH